MAKLISKTYGDALFELAQEENKIDVLFEEAQTVRDILRQESEFGKFMEHPKIPREEKVRTVEAVFRGKISQELMGFLVIIIQKDRYQELDAILTYFLEQVKEAKHIGVAFVTTAVALDEAARIKVMKRLLDTTTYASMEMHYDVDPEILGGMIIRIKDRVVDTSIRTKLNELKKQLLHIQLG